MLPCRPLVLMPPPGDKAAYRDSVRRRTSLAQMPFGELTLRVCV